MSYHPPEPVGSEPDLLDIDGERCARILQLLNDAWERASECQEVNPASGEVEITESLRDSLRDVINGQAVEWGNKVWVLPGTESRSRLRGHDLRPVWSVKVRKDFWPVGADDGFVAFPLT